MALVQRFEHLDRVQHGRLVRVRELFDQRFDGGRIDLGADRPWRDRARADAGAERAQVLPPCHERHRDPDHSHDQAGVAQASPIEPEPPRANQHQEQHGGERLAELLHGHVNERFRAEPQSGRNGEEQYLPRGLVERVAERTVQHACPSHGQERSGQQNERGARTEANWQQQQRSGDSPRSMNAAREPDLHSRTRPERDTRQPWRGNAAMASSLTRDASAAMLSC